MCAYIIIIINDSSTPVVNFRAVSLLLNIDTCPIQSFICIYVYIVDSPFYLKRVYI